jgi:hypothetical protein
VGGSANLLHYEKPHDEKAENLELSIFIFYGWPAEQ